ncbi:PrgI family protein [Actinomadura sp. KC216]|uniref:PrgI family protein n=1 Tax=Actinomadura sp. KC216 TaxID=2530370 RepID=UPI0010485025|nr:PrgI family protein [Actinomadura sp. KC216]TDB89962.1 PrgI family protein [Actinomadura sp. KC216]
MSNEQGQRPMAVKIPADVDQPDKILYGLTARQLAILGGTVAVVLWLWLTFQAVVPFPVLVAVATPVAAAGIVLSVARRDGMGLDRYAAAALAFMRSPKARVAAGEPVQPPPSWCRMRGRLPAPLRLPVRAVRHDGVMELADGGGVAVIVRAGTVAFSLRTAGEQASLVAGFGRWLNSLDSPVQLLVQARPVDLSGLADHITAQAPELPDPALEQAAGEHAAFLTEIGTAHDLLVRQVLIVISDGPPVSASVPWSKAQRQRTTRETGAQVVLRRAAEAVQALATLGVAAEVLDADACVAVLAESLSPGGPRPVDNAAPDELISVKQEGTT